MDFAKRLSFAAMMMASFAPSHAQEATPRAVRLKHRAFLYWGYNRAQFTTSDIHFTGPDYDFTLHNVVASDKPEPFTPHNYFGAQDIWVPQYNYRTGWFLNEHWSFSLGLDHIKYVMVNDQTVRITGDISAQRSAKYAGDADHDVQLTADFLRYEHTDGLNLLSIDADHYDAVWRAKSGRHALFVTEGMCAGPVIPRSDVRLFGVGLNNKFHLAGYGTGAQAGVFAVLWDRVFVRAAVRAGYVNLPDVLTTGTSEDRASQHFWFVEEFATLGALIGK